MVLRILIILILLTSCSFSATLGDLLTDLRDRAGETDSVTSSFTNPQARRWINTAQSKIVTLAGLLSKSLDTSYQKGDSLGIVLPTTFRGIEGVMIYVNQWEPVFPNPSFVHDTDKFQYAITWKNPDTAMFITKRVAFVGAKIRISYLGTATALTLDADVCEVRTDLQPFIIEEAYSFYLQSLKNFQAAALIQTTTRQDMGLGRVAQ